MRLALFGFNVVALAFLVVPAFLIFNALQGSAGLSLAGFAGVFGLGSAATLGAMAMLSRRGGFDPRRGVTLLTVGVVLLAVGFSWLFLASLSQ